MTGDQACAREAQNLITNRDRRYELFPSEIFDEHAWSMLLHLFVALVSNEVMGESRLMTKVKVSQEVGRRWIRHLIEDGQVQARDEGDDVILTGSSADRLRSYLSGIDSERATIFG